VTNLFKTLRFDRGRGHVLISGSLGIAAYDMSNGSLTGRATPYRRINNDITVGLVPLRDGGVAWLTASGDLSVVDLEDGTLTVAPVEARVGRAADLALAPDGNALLVAGDRGIAVLAVDGSGLIRRAVPAPAGQTWFGATSDAAWLTAWALDAAQSIHTPPSYWQCPADGGCRSAEGPPWVDNAMVSADPGADVWARVRIGERYEVQLFDVATRQPVSGPFNLELSIGGAFAVARDRSWVAINSIDIEQRSIAEVHALPSGERVATVDLGDKAMGMVLSTDGRDLLVFDPLTGNSSLIDTMSWQRRPSPLPPGSVAAAGYSQDGRWLVTADTAGELVVRNPHTFGEMRRMSSEGGSSRGGFVFSDDGRYMVSNQDWKGRLWDVESGELIGRPVEGSPAVSSTGFPGAVVRLVTADDTHVQIWRFDPPTWRDIACRAAGRNLTRAEWDQYGPRDTPYRATCSQWPAAA
jgi:hypothetical protein